MIKFSFIGFSNKSPAAATPPPIIIFSGFNRLTTLASPIPMYSPTIVNILFATGSPCFAASETIYGVISGFGVNSYILALAHILSIKANNTNK